MPIRKYLKASTEKYNIIKIYVVPDSTYSFEKYVTLALTPPDEFIASVKNKIKLSLSDSYSKKSIYYKIEAERAENTIEYLLAIVTLDPIFQKTIEKKLSLSKHLRINWMPYYYCLNKCNLSSSIDDNDVLTINIADKYTDLIVSRVNQIQFVKRLNFSLSQVEDALSKDHFSQNQLRTAIDIDLDFTRYNDLNRGISFKILVDNFLKDISRTMQVYQTTFSRTISRGLIVSDVFLKNKLAEFLEKELKITCRYHDKTSAKARLVEIDDQISSLSDEEVEVVLAIVSAHKRGDLFMPIRTMRPGFRHTMKQKLSLNVLIDNSWKKLLLGLILVLIVFFLANTYCSKAYDRSSKNLYSVKNKLAKVKQKYLDSMDTSQEIEQYQELIKKLDYSQKTVEKSAKLLKLIYKKRLKGISINHVSYNNRQNSFEIYGETAQMETVNNYLENIGKDLPGTEVNVNKIEKVAESNYQFFIEMKLN